MNAFALSLWQIDDDKKKGRCENFNNKNISKRKREIERY
jgi:hypothetical protein